MYMHMHAFTHTHTRTQTLPRCRLKNLLAALPAAQLSRRAVGSAALLWWVYCAGCLEVWQQPQQQRRCDVVGDKDSEIHVILFLPKTTHNKDVNKTHKHTHPELTPTHTHVQTLWQMNYNADTSKNTSQQQQEHTMKTSKNTRHAKYVNN